MPRQIDPFIQFYIIFIINTNIVPKFIKLSLRQNSDAICHLCCPLQQLSYQSSFNCPGIYAGDYDNIILFGFSLILARKYQAKATAIYDNI